MIRLKLLILLLLILIPNFMGISAAGEPEILINRRLAEKLQIKVGDIVEVSASGDMRNHVLFRVSSIYEEQADPFNVPLKRNLVKMHLPDLEELTGKSDQLDIITVKLTKQSDAPDMAARLNADAIGFTAFSAEELAQRTSSTFEVVSRFHEAIAFITMMAGAIFIFALVVMRVEDQRKNLAILTVTGISRKTILKALVLESLFFAFFASLLGAVLGIISAKLVNLYYQYYYQTSLIFAEVTPSVLTRAMLLSFLLGIVAGTFSWFRLRRLSVLQELGR